MNKSGKLQAGIRRSSSKVRTAFASTLIAALLVAGCALGSKPDEVVKLKPSSKERKAGANNQSSSFSGSELVDPPAELIAQSGIGAYPGAKVMSSMRAVQGTSEDDFVDVVYFTSDSSKRVFEFYKAKLVDPQVVATDSLKSGVYCLDGKNAAGDSMRIQAQSQAAKTTIHVIRRTKK